MSAPILCVIAGPNGIGKATSVYSVLPKGVPILNSDEIAKQIRTSGLVATNTQEYSNREAQRLVQEQLDAKGTFAMETNLADEETWKFLKGVNVLGYRFSCFFFQPMIFKFFTGASRKEPYAANILCGRTLLRNDTV